MESWKGGHVRLDRALSKLGLASRADAQRLIAGGRVSVRGTVVRNPVTVTLTEGRNREIRRLFARSATRSRS